MGQKRTKITVLLDNEEFTRFHTYCELQGFKKSTLIARLIRDFLNENRFNHQREFSFNHEDPKEGRR